MSASTYITYFSLQVISVMEVYSQTEPLILTPFLANGQYKEAQKLARVPLTDSFGFASYAGFFTVNTTYNSNQFFWYFPPLNGDAAAPVVVWLQGGPGASSLFGLFIMHGPIKVCNGTMHQRDITWARNHHMIYVDNPVGTGFSFTDDDKGLATDEQQVGLELYSTVVQFITMFPKLRQNKFFVTGESYGGKFVPALAYTIHVNNPTARIKINLKGIAIGNGICDPINQLDYSSYLYQHGLIDWNQQQMFEVIENKTKMYILSEEYEKAAKYFDMLIIGDYLHKQSLFRNITGFHYFYNYLQTYGEFEDFSKVVTAPVVRESLHVGDQPFHNNTKVLKALALDMVMSSAPMLSVLLEHYKVVMYNGQLDVLLPYPMMVNFLRKLDFSCAKEYETAPRHIWKVDGEIAGYTKQAGNLLEILIRNSGHLVPSDQPLWAMDLITRVTHDYKFH